MEVDEKGATFHMEVEDVWSLAEVDMEASDWEMDVDVDEHHVDESLHYMQVRCRNSVHKDTRN